MTAIIKLGQNLPPPLKKKLADPKISNLARFETRFYLRIGTRYRTALQAAITPVHAIPNLGNFGPQTVKNRTAGLTHSKSTFFDAHISWANGRFPSKISQLVEDDYRLLMHSLHTSSGWVCPQQFLTPKIRKLAKNPDQFSNFHR